MFSFISLVFCYSKSGFFDFNNMTRLIPADTFCGASSVCINGV